MMLKSIIFSRAEQSRALVCLLLMGILIVGVVTTLRLFESRLYDDTCTEESTIELIGIASQFKVRNDLNFPDCTVENEFIKLNNQEIYIAYDDGMNGILSVKDFSSNEEMDGELIGEIRNGRFPYFYKDENRILFVSAINHDICIRNYKNFEDLVNGEKPQYVTYLDGRSNGYKYMWNSALCEYNDGYLMLVESENAEGQEDVRLSTWISEDLDFSDKEKKDSYIERAGNPWIVNLGDNRILAFHGMISDEGYWKINASVYKDGKWYTAPDNIFCIKEQGGHICDPSVLSNGKKTILSFSYKQEYTMVYESEMSLNELFNKLDLSRYYSFFY